MMPFEGLALLVLLVLVLIALRVRLTCFNLLVLAVGSLAIAAVLCWSSLLHLIGRL